MSRRILAVAATAALLLVGCVDQPGYRGSGGGFGRSGGTSEAGKRLAPLLSPYTQIGHTLRASRERGRCSLRHPEEKMTR
jgi:hypothetical protein